MSSAALHSFPREEGMGKALALALLVHIALVVFLWVGVRWQNEPAVAEAEVWDMQVRDAAPKPVAQPEPVAPPPAFKAPVASEPQPVQREVVPKPDIALEREKKRKEAEQRAQEQREKSAEAKRQKEAKLAEQKKQALADQKALEVARADEMRRLTASMGSGGSGSAAKSTGNGTDTSYEQKIKAKIKANTAFAVPPGLNGNPPVEYQVDLLPDGSLRSSPRKLKSSGVPGFDEAVLRAIEKSSPFPADRYGKVPSSIKITHKPKE